MRCEVYGKLQRLPVAWFDQRASGDLMTRIIEDVNSVERVLIDGTEQGTVALLSVVGVTAFMFHLNPTLAFVAMIPLPLLTAGAVVFASGGKSYYVAGALPVLMAAGAIAVHAAVGHGRQQRRLETVAQVARPAVLLAEALPGQHTGGAEADDDDVVVGERRLRGHQPERDRLRAHAVHLGVRDGIRAHVLDGGEQRVAPAHQPRIERADRAAEQPCQCPASTHGPAASPAATD